MSNSEQKQQPKQGKTDFWAVQLAERHHKPAWALLERVPVQLQLCLVEVVPVALPSHEQVSKELAMRCWVELDLGIELS